MLCKYRGLQDAPRFKEFMEIQVGALARKPVRARCALCAVQQTVHRRSIDSQRHEDFKPDGISWPEGGVSAWRRPFDPRWLRLLLFAIAAFSLCRVWCNTCTDNAKEYASGRFAVHKLDLPVNCDAALSAARDYFERVTREYHTKGPDGRDRSQVSLDSQTRTWLDDDNRVPVK